LNSVLRTLFQSGPWKILLLLSLLPAIGTMGFSLIEKWTIFDSLYMSVITLSTVGFLEVHPLSTAGRIFVMLYLALGLSSFLYALAQMGEWIAQVGFSQLIKRAALQRKIENMKGHFLICGFGRMGQRICEELVIKKELFIVIDKDPLRLEAARSKQYITFEGDATDDQCLKQCKVTDARGLCAVLTADADNLLLVLSAKLLSPNLHIVARAVEESNERKLIQAGASKVVSLYHTSALKAVENLVNPSLLDVVEIESGSGLSLEMAEIRVDSQSKWLGKTDKDLRSMQNGILVVGVLKKSNQFSMGIQSQLILEIGDTVILAGHQKSIMGQLREGLESE
jgi:voltage-gated potassium channel